jgi:hypothetical protein
MTTEIQEFLKDIEFECWCRHTEAQHTIDDWGLAECLVTGCECADYEPEENSPAA